MAVFLRRYLALSLFRISSWDALGWGSRARDRR